ncbi:globin family protein [Bosea sp. NBC_00550]|uniref:globin family protein n=1 Tax=Bosea sp. NBC_00550 TaxID=2969621 RepID=UPI00222FEF24|nr:globin family protein [Bosea sp. NBC_00550]UZF92360.1 globin domain-containing protein [Bosea sp. NBC_00550]
MTPDQVSEIRASFSKVAPIAEQAAALFYGRLFEIAPEVRPLFQASDMKEQGRKLMGTLAVVVKGLDDLPALMPAVNALAVKHNGYGVTAAHYAPVGAALLWTLEQGLGEGFTPAVRDAWTNAYGTLSGAMIAAASQNTTA